MTHNSGYMPGSTIEDVKAMHPEAKAFIKVDDGVMFFASERGKIDYLMEVGR